MLIIKDVVKQYGNKMASDHISLEIEDGQIFGFIGPNGAGKSTLIKSIAGLHKFDSGSIVLNDLTLEKNELAYKSEIAYIPDNPDLYDHLTGIKYLNFVCDIFKIGTEERTTNINKYASLFELTNDLANSISSYSHGMKQKLAIISALIHNPKLLIMDEPFVGLDPKSSFTLKEIMKEFVGKGNIIFFSSHVLEVVEKLCDHIAIINNGKIVYDGAVDDIKGDESLEKLFLEITGNE